MHENERQVFNIKIFKSSTHRNGLLFRLQLAFRSIQKSLHDVRSQYRQLLGLSDSSPGGSTDALVNEVERTVSLYLRKTVDRRNVSHDVKVSIGGLSVEFRSKLKICRSQI